MQTLRECIAAVAAHNAAIGHFNISDSNQLKALASAARETNLPVIVGLSEGERAFFPLSHARALIDAYRAEGIHLYLNADHTYSIEKAREAIDAGVDAIVVDGAKLSFEENVAYAKAVAAYARASGRDVLVEGELGYIGQSSSVHEALPEGAAVTEALMTTGDEIARFVAETQVDLMAPAVGNVHGIIRGGDPKLSIERIRELSGRAGVPLVLHGASGNAESEYVEAIAAGVRIIHINTELRLTYRNTLAQTIAQRPAEVAPYKFLEPAVAAMSNFVSSRLSLFDGR